MLLLWLLPNNCIGPEGCDLFYGLPGTVVHLMNSSVSLPVSSTVREERCVSEHCQGVRGGGVGKGYGQPCVEQVMKSFKETEATYETQCRNLIGCFSSIAGWEIALQIEPVLCSFNSCVRPFVPEFPSHPWPLFKGEKVDTGKARAVRHWYGFDCAGM